MSDANVSEDSCSAKDQRHPVIPEDATIILPVRNMLLFPGMVLPLTIGRPASIAAAQEAAQSGRQIGFARIITDFVTYAYLCDVYIVEERRGRGLGTWLIRSVLEHPDLKNLKRVSLITHDAQDFYRGLGFCFLPDCNCYMEAWRR